jgi:hypothetical protein
MPLNPARNSETRILCTRRVRTIYTSLRKQIISRVHARTHEQVMHINKHASPLKHARVRATHRIVSCVSAENTPGGRLVRAFEDSALRAQKTRERK